MTERLTPEQVRALLEEGRRGRAQMERDEARRALRAAEMCDACAGAGVALGGRPCGCGGTGRLADMLEHVRREVFRLERELEAVRAERDRLREAAEASMVCGCGGASGCPWTPLHRAIAETAREDE